VSVQNAPVDDAVQTFTCGMHPDRRLPHFGDCPSCGMNLVPLPYAPLQADLERYGEWMLQGKRALGEAYFQPVEALAQANPSAGESLYGDLCASCHGPRGRGDGPAATGSQPPPADLSHPVRARYLTDAGRIHLVAQGIPGSMPGAAQLSKRQQLDLYAHVASLRGPAPVVP